MTDDYAVKEFVEPTTGKVRRQYSYKRKPCRRIVLESRFAAQLSGYTLIEKDLRSALVWLNEIDSLHTSGPTRKGERFGRGGDRDQYNMIKGLFVAALTFYGKCFSKCEGRPVKLERAQLDARYQEMHDTCLRFRHNFAAHSGAAQLESVQIAVVLPMNSRKSVLPKLYRELTQPDLLWPSAPDVTLAELFKHVRGIAMKKIEKLSEKILAEEVYPKGREYWLRK